MTTLLRIDSKTLPRKLVLDPPISDAEFEALCRESHNMRLELTKEGVVRMNPPTGGWTGSGNQEISRQLGNWQTAHKTGRVFDSSTAFRLPDGSTLSPDASFLSEERLRSLPKGALRGFPRICPDFVIELRSESDGLKELKDKMKDWIANGAQLGWLIDPAKKQAFVFRPGHPTEVVAGNKIAGDGPIKGFILELSGVWDCYTD